MDRSTRDDFTARVLVAIPAGLVAILLIVAGGAWFAVGLGLLGAVCLHELFEMFSFARPSRIAATAKSGRQRARSVGVTPGWYDGTTSPNACDARPARKSPTVWQGAA